MSTAMAAVAPSPLIQRYGYLLAMVGNLTARIAQLVVLIVLPPHIGLTNYGMFALVLTVGEIVEMTTSNWARLLLVRQTVTRDEPDSGAGAIASTPRMRALFVGSTLFAFIVGVAATPGLVDHDDAAFALATGAYIVAFAAYRLLIAILQAGGRQLLVGALEFLRGLLTLLLVGATVMAQQHAFLWPALALSAAVALSALVGLFAMANGETRALLRKRLKPGAFATIGLPIIIASALSYQFGWLDRLVIQSWLGPQVVGLYVAAMTVGRQPVDLVLSSLNMQTFPVVLGAAAPGQSPQKLIAGVLLAACILGFGAAGALLGLSQPLAQVLLPSFDRATVAIIIPLVAFGSVFIGLKSFVFDNLFHAWGQNWLMLRWFAIIALATLALSIIGIARWGAVGAAGAYLLGSAASLVASASVSRRVFAFETPWNAIARIALAAALATGAAHAAAWIGGSYAWVHLLIGSLAFCLVYLAALSVLVHFNLRRFIARPWDMDGATSRPA